MDFTPYSVCHLFSISQATKALEEQCLQAAPTFRQEKDIGSLRPIEAMALHVVQMISLYWRSQAMDNPIVEVAIMVGGTCASLGLMKGRSKTLTPHHQG